MANLTAVEVQRLNDQNIVTKDTRLGDRIADLENLSTTPLQTLGSTVALGVATRGVASTASRSDHVHAHGDLSAAVGTMHDASQIANLTELVLNPADVAEVAAPGISGTPAAQDHVHAHGDLSASTGPHHLAAAIEPSPKNRLGLLGSFKAELDATLGLAIGTHLFGPVLPLGARITRAWYKVTTTFQSGGLDTGTIALGIQTDDAAGLIAAIAINDVSNPWDAGTLVDCIPVGAAATHAGPTTTNTRQLAATVAVEALTAGVLMVYAEYVIEE